MARRSTARMIYVTKESLAASVREAKDRIVKNTTSHYASCLGYYNGLPYHSQEELKDLMNDSKEKVNHPNHYNDHPSGVECLDIIRHMNFNLGNVVKYVWRADLKEDAIQDLEKAVFYLKDEINKRKNDQS